ncbi:MAG TPA: hypothetical protein DD422_02270, partial [Akkermansia sp.]|nr:hypothetical protein [Akkermansia sp.]
MKGRKKYAAPPLFQSTHPHPRRAFPCPAPRKGTKPLTAFMFDILLQHNTLVLFGIIFFGIA